METQARPRTSDTPALAAAMRRMSKPLRRIRQNFESRDVRNGGLFGKLWWREVGGARVGGFLGFITDGRGWAHVDPDPPEAIVFAFVRPVDHPLHRRVVGRKGSLFERVARRSRYEGVSFELFRGREEALVRHRSMRGRPDEILTLSACDFFMTSFRAFWASDLLAEIQKLKAPRRRSKR